MSKKALVRFDPTQPEKLSSDFLAPFRDERGAVGLASLKTGKPIQYGLVVFTGRAVTANDVFAKVVDAGHKVPSVPSTLADLEAFITQLSLCGIGAVVELQTSTENACGFLLKKTAFKSGSPEVRSLP
jgi:hypothetical protein